MSGTHSTEMPMLDQIRKTIAFLREKQIFHKLGVLLSLTIIAIACYVLYHMLRGLDFDELVKALKAKPSHSIVLAMLFVAAGYFTLTFYDLFALRTIGRYDVPYRDRGARRLHQLFDRTQCRRQRADRRRRALSRLFGMGPECGRRRQDLLRCRAHLLARQRGGAGHRHQLSSGSCVADRSPAGLAQSDRRLHHPCRARRLRRLGVDAPACRRPRSVVGDAAGRTADAAADRDRHRRSRLLRAGDVHARAGYAAYRLRDGRGDLRLGDAAWICQSLARRARRVRCGDAGRSLAVRLARSCWPACCCFACSITSRRSCSRC